MGPLESMGPVSLSPCPPLGGPADEGAMIEAETFDIYD